MYPRARGLINLGAISQACGDKMWGSPELKKLILSREGDGVNPGQLVVRPDSGVPKDVSRVHAWLLSERTLCVRAFLLLPSVTPPSPSHCQ